jgi:hypothetical protein
MNIEAWVAIAIALFIAIHYRNKASNKKKNDN